MIMYHKHAEMSNVFGGVVQKDWPGEIIYGASCHIVAPKVHIVYAEGITSFARQGNIVLCPRGNGVCGRAAKRCRPQAVERCCFLADTNTPKARRALGDAPTFVALASASESGTISPDREADQTIMKYLALLDMKYSPYGAHEILRLPAI